MKTNLEDLKKFTKDELIMRVEKLETSNARLTSEVQELSLETIQKRNLINELSFWIIREIEQINNIDKFTVLEKKTNIKILINIISSCKDYTNKQIKELIKELKFQLPF